MSWDEASNTHGRGILAENIRRIISFGRCTRKRRDKKIIHDRKMEHEYMELPHVTYGVG
jgi:hypothetical protein